MKLDRNAMQTAIAGLLNEQRLAILATVSQQSPYCNLVAFTPSDDLQTIIFTTPRSYPQVRQHDAQPQRVPACG